MFKKKPNKKHIQFIQDVIEGKITDMIEIATFIHKNGRVDVDDKTYNQFGQTIEKLQQSKRVNKPTTAPFTESWRLVDDHYQRDFVVLGVGYENRQEIIANVKKRKPLTFNESTYKGEPSIQILFENKCIGYIAEDNVDLFIEKKEYIQHIEVDRTYTNRNGDKGLFALVVISKKAFE